MSGENMNTPTAGDLANKNDKIPSLLVPMATGSLIVPTVSVAEIVPRQPLQPRQPLANEETPVWYLGNLPWRGVMVPTLSFEALNGDPVAPITAESQLLVLNNTGVHAQLPFISLITSGIPRLRQVAAGDISENPALPLKDYAQMQVIVTGEPAILPDIPKIEQACAQLLGYLA